MTRTRAFGESFAFASREGETNDFGGRPAAGDAVALRPASTSAVARARAGRQREANRARVIEVNFSAPMLQP